MEKEAYIKVTPDKEKASSILNMVDTTLEMINEINTEKFPSNVIKEYYDVIRELISVILLLDGYKTYGEGAHKKLIGYIEKNCKSFEKNQIDFINELRKIRNKISYDGFFVTADYLKRKINIIKDIISKLKVIINEKKNK